MAENAEHEHLRSAEQEQHEKMIRLNMLEQDAKQIEQQIAELQNLKIALGEIEKAKEKDEILASLGKNIFVKMALLSKDLLVNVGAKTVVKKSIPETKKLVENDIAKLSELKDKIAVEFQGIVQELIKD